ncbi:MAG: transcriptional repressor LexA [Burkholderiales bacterium]|nr:transcriptional repressor LexA [Burkholderiales bacterium]
MADDKHLATLRDYYKRVGAFPSIPRLCEVVGLSSTSSVFALIGRLSSAGYVERIDGRVVPTKKFFARPLLGSVRAGLPQPADQSEPEVLTLDDFLIDAPNRTSLHKVRGDSMRDVGILDGDLVAVEHNAPSAPGDIVVAVVDGELTVKTLRRDADEKFYLEAANPAYEPIRPKTSLEILGVVVSVCRRVRR